MIKRGIFVLVVVVLFGSSFNFVNAADEKKQFIFIGIDGMQVNHFKEMFDDGKMPNFQRLIDRGGWIGNASITGHTNTETAPGNAELHTGLGSSLNHVSVNNDTAYIPAGLTTYERLHAYNSSIKLGLVYGKGTNYIPDSILRNAKKNIPITFWYNRSQATYNQTTYVSSNCAYSQNASNQAIKFLNSSKNDSFYLTVYFGAPDCAGHSAGENTLVYNNSLINVDDGLGVLLDWIDLNGLNVTIIISGDHGWNEGTTGHGTNDTNTNTIILASNNASFVSKYTKGKRKQCDIAPTTLNYFGMNKSQYQDITTFGCGSMIASINGTCGNEKNICRNGTAFDISENATHFIWKCLGQYEGANANCSIAKSAFVYHPSDNNPSDKMISGNELNIYMDGYMAGGIDLKNLLYALTIVQHGRNYSYTGFGTEDCTNYPWDCWESI